MWTFIVLWTSIISTRNYDLNNTGYYFDNKIGTKTIKVQLLKIT